LIAIHPGLTTETAGRVPIEGSFTREAIPKDHQGCLIHCIDRGLGSVGKTIRVLPNCDNSRGFTNLTNWSKRQSSSSWSKPDPGLDPGGGLILRILAILIKKKGADDPFFFFSFFSLECG